MVRYVTQYLKDGFHGYCYGEISNSVFLCCTHRQHQDATCVIMYYGVSNMMSCLLGSRVLQTRGRTNAS